MALVIDVFTMIPKATERFDRSLGHICDPFWRNIEHGAGELVMVFLP